MGSPERSAHADSTPSGPMQLVYWPRTRLRTTIRARCPALLPDQCNQCTGPERGSERRSERGFQHPFRTNATSVPAPNAAQNDDPSAVSSTPSGPMQRVYRIRTWLRVMLHARFPARLPGQCNKCTGSERVSERRSERGFEHLVRTNATGVPGPNAAQNDAPTLRAAPEP